MTAIPPTTTPKAKPMMPNNHSDMRLDDETIQASVASYPEDVREPIRWLAGYVRERCNGKTAILLNRVKELGFSDKTKNYFYTVFTGKYFKVVDGKVQGSVANLLQIIDAVRAGVVLSQRAGQIPFIETGTYRSIRDLFDRRRMPSAICKFAVVIGPTGAQKTSSGKQYCEAGNSKRFNSCIHLEVPESPTMGTLLADLCQRFGKSTWSKEATKKADIRSCVDDRTFFVFDNVQRLHVPRANGKQPAFSFIQKLQDDTNCGVGFLFAKDRANFLTDGDDKEFFEQFEGRAGGASQFLHLPDFAPREDIIDIARAYGVAGDLDADHSPEIAYLERLSRERGRVRILFDALQTARQLNEGKPLTLDLIKEARGDK